MRKREKGREWERGRDKEKEEEEEKGELRRQSKGERMRARVCARLDTSSPSAFVGDGGAT